MAQYGALNEIGLPRLSRLVWRVLLGIESGNLFRVRRWRLVYGTAVFAFSISVYSGQVVQPITGMKCKTTSTAAYWAILFDVFAKLRH